MRFNENAFLTEEREWEVVKSSWCHSISNKDDGQINQISLMMAISLHFELK